LLGRELFRPHSYTVLFMFNTVPY